MAHSDSFATIEVIIQGHRFMGWSDDDPPLEFSDEDGNEFSVGADGGLYAIGNPQFGTEMTFKVFPNSPTVQWAINQEQMRKDDLAAGNDQVIYAGSYINPATGDSYRLSGGFIMNFPSTRVPGVTYEGTMKFEEIASSVGTARFTPPRSS